MSSRVFETTDHANKYFKFRPILPKQVLDHVLNYLNECIDSKQWDIVVDVGCGSGQCTNQLSPHFKHVYGFDVSSAQIKEANHSQHPKNVNFNISEAEKLTSVETNSVQLLTACVAAHWFDLEKFFVETNRILTHNGVVALIGYSLLEPFDPLNPNDPTLTELVLRLRQDPILAPYKLPNTVSIDKRYTNIVFPDSYHYVYKDNIINTIHICAQDIIGFIESWSPYQQMFKYSKPEAEKFISEFKEKLKFLLGINDLSEKKLLCNFRYFIAMGRKNKKID